MNVNIHFCYKHFSCILHSILFYFLCISNIYNPHILVIIFIIPLISFYFAAQVNFLQFTLYSSSKLNLFSSYIHISLLPSSCLFYFLPFYLSLYFLFRIPGRMYPRQNVSPAERISGRTYHRKNKQRGNITIASPAPHPTGYLLLFNYRIRRAAVPLIPLPILLFLPD